MSMKVSSIQNTLLSLLQSELQVRDLLLSRGMTRVQLLIQVLILLPFLALKSNYKWNIMITKRRYKRRWKNMHGTAKLNTIGHFRITCGLFFKASPGADPFI